jgi:hypothetical protein
LTRKHEWVAKDSQANGLGPMQLKFEQSSNLISLNFDLVFSHNDLNGIKDKFSDAVKEAALA